MKFIDYNLTKEQQSIPTDFEKVYAVHKEFPLSAVIITYNEEEHIEKCLASLVGVADEIIVVDSFSTDKTEQICNMYNVNCIKHNFEGYIEQKNFAIQQAKYNYILSLDGDEALSEKLKKINSKHQNTLGS